MDISQSRLETRPRRQGARGLFGRHPHDRPRGLEEVEREAGDEQVPRGGGKRVERDSRCRQRPGQVAEPPDRVQGDLEAA